MARKSRLFYIAKSVSGWAFAVSVSAGVLWIGLKSIDSLKPLQPVLQPLQMITMALGMGSGLLAWYNNGDLPDPPTRTVFKVLSPNQSAAVQAATSGSWHKYEQLLSTLTDTEAEEVLAVLNPSVAQNPLFPKP